VRRLTSTALTGRFLTLAVLLPLTGTPAPAAALERAITREGAMAPLEVEVRVVEEPASDAWRLAYRFDRPVAGLWFPRDRIRFRAAGWRPLAAAENGVPPRWAQRRDGEILVSAGPTTSFELRLAADFAPKQGEYELHVPFSDGSRLLFTGYLTAYPLFCDQEEPCGLEELKTPETLAAFRWTFRTAAGRGISLGEADAEGQLSWIPSRRDLESGMFVFFGDLRPAFLERVTAVIDPGMPPWIVERMRAFLPQAVAYIAGATGIELRVRPRVFLSYAPGAEREILLSGGTVQGAIQLKIEGTTWRSEGYATVPLWLRTLAHEIFHLWNNRMFRYEAEPGGEWLSEGSADYVALRLLRDLAFIPEVAFRAALVRAANMCMIGLDGRPLQGAEEPVSREHSYSCGTLIHYLMDASLPGKGRGGRDTAAGVAALYGELFLLAERGGSACAADQLFEVFEASNGRSSTRRAIDRILYEGIERRADRFLHRLLTDLGLPVERVPLAQGPLDPSTSRGLLTDLLSRCDCRSQLLSEVRTRSIVFGPGADCSFFARPQEVASVEGASVVRDPAQAWSQALFRIRRGEPIRLTRTGSPIAESLTCRKSRVGESFDTLLRLVPPSLAAQP
jgi:hypothetical protein